MCVCIYIYIVICIHTHTHIYIYMYIYFFRLFSIITQYKILYNRSLLFILCMCARSITQLCLTILQPHGLQPAKLLCPWDQSGKNTGAGCHFQRIFPTQGSNPGLAFPALADGFFKTSTAWEALFYTQQCVYVNLNQMQCFNRTLLLEK